MIHAIEMGWFVLSKYYGLSDATPAYAAAILLHPQKRACYIEKRWDKDCDSPQSTLSGLSGSPITRAYARSHHQQKHTRKAPYGSQLY